MRRLPFALLGVLFAGSAFFFFACRSTQQPAPASAVSAAWLADATADSHLAFVHVAQPEGTYAMPRSMGSGAALLDFDGDGRLDVYLLQHGGPDSGVTNRLFHQEPDKTFRDVSKGSGLDVAGYGTGVAAGDLTNDGRVDLVVTEYGRIRLFVNNGDGTFTDATSAAGVDNPVWGMSISLCDFDRDGWLDIAIANYVDYKPATLCDDRAGKHDFCGPWSFATLSSRLFRSRGVKSGSAQPAAFEDVTARSGIGGRRGAGLGIVCADFTGDRWPDLLIANDGAANHLWVNQHDGTFADEAALRGIAYDGMGRPEANMGIAVGDADGDGLDDVYVTHLTSELHRAWMQGPQGFFQDRTAAIGLSRPKWRSTGFGVAFGDFDQDGALDLVQANGRVRRDDALADGNPDHFWNVYGERNQLFANDGHGRFRDISTDNAAFAGQPSVSRGLAIGDIDGDGALDVLVSRIASSVQLFRNVAPRRGHWLKIRAVDPALGGRDVYGAEVRVRAGSRSWTRTINPGYSYLSSNAPDAHFGLGSVERVDNVSVVWPDGQEEMFPGSGVDKTLLLKRSRQNR